MSDKNKIGRVSDLSKVPSINEFLKRNNMKMTGMRRASKKVMENGYEKDEFTVRFKEGLYANVWGPTFLFKDDDERDEIIEDLKTTELPQIVPFTDEKMGVNSPKPIKNTSTNPQNWKNIDWSKDDVLCPLFNERGEMVMIEQRYRDKDGGKQCVRWSYHDDSIWRHNDPDLFPLWGLDQMKDGPDTVFIHEGPKAASAGRRFYQWEILGHKERKEIQKHPWFPILSRYPHLGWIGGANRSERSNWKKLKALGVTRVIIFPDNDTGGQAAVYKIAGFLAGIDVFTLPDYPEGTKMSWDLADGCSLLGDGWQGMLRNLRDITPYWKWVDAPTKNDPDKMKAVPLEGQPKNVAYIRETDEFTLVDQPDKSIKKGSIGMYFAQHLHPSLIEKYAHHVATQRGTVYDGLTFEPERGSVINEDGDRLLNLWRPTTVTEHPMDERGRRIWGWMLSNLATDPLEQAIIRRFIATSVVHPRRKHFGAIIHSRENGTGKSTIPEHALPPLIGTKYCAFPTRDQIGGRFTEWRKQACFIYADEVSATKDKSAQEIAEDLKTQITASKAKIEDKGKTPFWVPNYSTTMINSNAKVPLALNLFDRRWFVAHGRERRMTRGQFLVFQRWLENGGYGMILHWARRIADDPKAAVKKEWLRTDAMRKAFDIPLEAGFIPEGANAPLTDAKIQMQLDSNFKWFPNMVKVWELLQDDALRTTETEDEWEAMIDKPQKPLAVPDVVFAEAVEEFCASSHERSRPSSVEDIYDRLPMIGAYIAPSKKLSKEAGDKVIKTQKKIGGKKAGRYSIIMNREAVEWAIEHGFIDERDVDHTKMTYLTRPEAGGKGVRKFDQMLKKMESAGIFRPLWIYADQKTMTVGYQSPKTDGENKSGHLKAVDGEGAVAG